MPALPRALAEHEWPVLRGAVNQVFRPGGGDLTAEYPLLFDQAHRENLRVIVGTSAVERPEAAGEPGSAAGGASGCGAEIAEMVTIIAHAGYVAREALVFRRRLRLSCIGAVFTAAGHRGRGFGSRVFADALARARKGADLVMVSGDRDLYRRQGLAPVPPLSRFRLPPAQTGAGDAGPAAASADGEAHLAVRDAEPADLNSMATLYDAEDVHFFRSPDDWRRLWTAGRLVDAPAAFHLVERGGNPVAYLVVQRDASQPDGSARPRRILEFAGDRQAVVEAAPLVADELLVPAYDATAVALCERKGWFHSRRQFPVTAEALSARVPVIPWYGLNYV